MNRILRLVTVRSAIVLVALMACISGCSKPKFYPVRGDVVVYGVGPLREGEVRVRPVKNHALIATGKIDKDGRFSVSTPSHPEGVLEGDVEVAVVVEPKNGKPQIAERFADFSTADRNFTVLNRDENYFQIQVSK